MTKSKLPESKRRANAKYDANTTQHFAVKLNKRTDVDIINALTAAPNKQGFIKEAIRFYLENKK